MALVNIQPWKNQLTFNTTGPTDLGTWTAGGTLSFGTVRGAAFWITKEKAYSVGGYVGGGASSILYTATITGGTIGTWATASNSLPQAIVWPIPILTKYYIYLIAFTDSSGNSQVTTYKATIDQDTGVIGSWSTGTDLAVATRSAQVAVIRNRIYLIGGWGTEGLTETIQYADVDSSGVIGSWTTGTALPDAYASGMVFVTNGYIYHCGGRDASSSITEILHAPIDSNGISGSWTTYGNLPTEIANAGIIYHANEVFIVGGYGLSAGINGAYRAAINSDGTIGSWSACTGSLGVTTFYDVQHQMLITSTRLYRFGGTTASTINYINFAGGYDNYLDSCFSVDPAAIAWMAKA